MTIKHHLIIIQKIAENYKIKELVLESMKKNQSINSFCVEATSSIFDSSACHRETALEVLAAGILNIIS